MKEADPETVAIPVIGFPKREVIKDSHKLRHDIQDGKSTPSKLEPNSTRTTFSTVLPRYRQMGHKGAYPNRELEPSLTTHTRVGATNSAATHE